MTRFDDRDINDLTLMDWSDVIRELEVARQLLDQLGEPPPLRVHWSGPIRGKELLAQLRELEGVIVERLRERQQQQQSQEPPQDGGGS